MEGSVTLPAAGLRFLVVEDDGFQRWALARILRELGAASVTEAQDGSEAIAELRGECSIDVILTDLRMPGMDGIEFVRHLREAGCRARLIVLSELEPALLESVAQMATAYGASLAGTLRKPIRKDSIARLLRDSPVGSVSARGDEVPRSFDRDELAAALRNAEVVPYFQPKFSLAGNEIVGAEALARWLHPRLGTIAAQAFMPFVEAHGLVDALTTRMLEASLEGCRAWRARDCRAKVAINMSITSFGEAGLADRIEETTLRKGLMTSDVIVEITETAAATHLGRALENLARLRLKGFGLSLDDYGTGYASMEQLARIPFTELKVDRWFVQRAPRDAAAKALLQSSFAIASSFGIPAVAEGIETQEQHLLVKEMGCQLGQGRLYGDAMPLARFTERLARDAAG